MRETHVSFERT